MTQALGVHGKAPGANGRTTAITPALTTQAAGSSFFVVNTDPNQDIKVEDNKGNGKYRRILLNVGPTSKLSIWACFNGNGGSGHQATVTWLSGTADTNPTFHEVTAASGFSPILAKLAQGSDNSAPQSLTTPALPASGLFGIVAAHSEGIVADYNESTGYVLSEEETNDSLYWTQAVRYKTPVGPTAESPNFPTVGSGQNVLFGYVALAETQTNTSLGDSGQDFQLDGVGTSPSTITLNTQPSGSMLLVFAAGEFAKMDPPTYNGGGAMTLRESSGYGVPAGSLWAGYGFEIYGDSITGGSGHVVSMVKPVSPAQESTLIAVEVKGGSSIADTSITTVAAAGAMATQTSASVTTSGPAMLVALWSGDGGVGTTDQTATPGDGWIPVQYSFQPGTAYIQAAVAIKFVEAGTHVATWQPAFDQGAILGLVAVQGSGGVAPSFTTHPVTQTVADGKQVTLSVVAPGATGYQWYDNSTGSFAAISGEVSASYTFTASIAASGRKYYCIATNANGNTQSNTAIVIAVGVPQMRTIHERLPRGGDDVWDQVQAAVVLDNDVFDNVVASGGLANVWTGSAWQAKPVKYWNGSSWTTKPLKRWNGSAWV